MELLLLLLPIYLIPSFIAAIRNHNDRYAIVFFNIVLGWTGILWLVFVGWSLTGNVTKKNDNI